MNNPNQPIQKQIQVHNFTVAYSGRVNVLVTDIKVSLPIIQGSDPSKNPIYPSKAIWDTGASGSVITKKAAQALGLLPVGKTNVHGVNSSSIANVYFVSITLPNNVTISHLKVTESETLNGPFDVLIGMDIIGAGDFAVTNVNNQTVMSFRLPSVSRIDFTNPNNSVNIQGGHPQNRQERRAAERNQKKKR